MACTPCLQHTRALLSTWAVCKCCAAEGFVCFRSGGGRVFCVSSVVCTRGVHKGFVSHTYSMSGLYSARSSTPGCPCIPPIAALQPAPALPSMGVVMASCSCLGMKCPAGVPASLAAVQQDSACSPAGFSRLEGFSVSHSPSQHSPGSV